MATLNTLAYQVAHSFDRATDLIFIERVKDLIKSTRSMLIHREIDKYGVNEAYIQSYVAKLIRVNASEVSTITSNVILLRTENKIPKTIRYQSDVPFVYVGSVDRLVPFRYIKAPTMLFNASLRFIGGAVTYFYINGYIFVYNNTKIENVLIEAPYDSLEVTGNTDPTGICYENDMEFPLAGDMLNTVIMEVINIIRSTQDANPNPITLRDIN